MHFRFVWVSFEPQKESLVQEYFTASQKVVILYPKLISEILTVFKEKFGLLMDVQKPKTGQSLLGFYMKMHVLYIIYKCTGYINCNSTCMSMVTGWLIRILAIRDILLCVTDSDK